VATGVQPVLNEAVNGVLSQLACRSKLNGQSLISRQSSHETTSVSLWKSTEFGVSTLLHLLQLQLLAIVC